MSLFFLKRPVFAWVISILIMLAGILSIKQMPVEQYPDVIAPPQVSISAFYPGASAETVENSVTQVLEKQLTGIDKMRYIQSQSDSSGSVTITVTLDPAADPDIAQVQVQNKIQAAMSQLPAEVTSQGVVVEKTTAGFLMVIALYSEEEGVTQADLGDIVDATIYDPLARIDGVGSVNFFGTPYAMRIWLDPNKLYSYNLSTNDVLQAIQNQNLDVSAGQIGGMPAVKGQEINFTVLAQSRLKTIDQFKEVILRVNDDGSQVLLRDVAKLNLGEENYNTVVKFSGHPATGLAISLAKGANALEVAQKVKDKLEELSPFLPKGVEYAFPYDTTPFVKISIEEVIKTLVEAIILVFLVMFLFLQSFRATIIPTIAVPIVLLGTFAILNACGFTINTLSMFAMVLAIGLLVDDAIVVVENVERVMSEEGLGPREATEKSMGEITGALVGIAMVLSAVFGPMAFFGGSAGAIYRQFSITIISAMGLSVLVALILTPVLCATILKPIPKGHHKKRSTGFFGWFNKFFNATRTGSQWIADGLAKRIFRGLILYALLVAGVVFLFQKMPTAFLPDEDQGVCFVLGFSPAGASIERTGKAVSALEEYLLEHEQDTVKSFFTVSGFSFAGNGQNTAIAFVMLKDFEERTTDRQDVNALTQRIMKAMYPQKDAMLFSFIPPPIIALGNATGFDFQLIDRTGHGHEALMEARNKLLYLASQNPKMVGVRPNGLDDVPEYKLEVDMQKARALGVSVNEINATLQTAWGSSYVNDFIGDGRVKKVYVQGQNDSRMQPEDFNKWYVKNNADEMVPISSFTTASWITGSPKLERFNGLSSVNIQGAPAPGVSSGEAMAEIEKMLKQLPEGFGGDWTGLSFEERESGSQAGALYALSLIVIFLCLAALYESWSIPFSVLLVVPLGVVGSVVATLVFGMKNDVYFQVALLTTVGLCAKNAILVVEFAKDLHEKGLELVEATIMAFKMRFRPIIMTSMAFVLGVLPMAKSDGAGSASQNAIGIAVIGGMASATFLALFFVPMFFILVEKISFSKKKDVKKND